MTTAAIFAIPGDLDTLTGGFGYDRRVLEQAAGRLQYMQLPGDFPDPSSADLARAMSQLRATPRDTVLLVDGLAYGALPADALATIPNPIVALTHHPLGLETGLDEATRQRLIDTERMALARANAVIVTSQTTRDTLIGDFAVPASRIAIAEPGVDPAPRAQGSGGATPLLLAVGSLIPRKGYDVLIDALTRLRALDWRLRIVGGARAPDCAEALRAQVAAAGLGERIVFAGEMPPDRLAEEYAAADVFTLSSHYEGYGMVLAEAMARGLPIVTTTGGAADKTAPDEAALKVPPGDAVAMTQALARVLGEPALRARLAEASWRAGQSLPRWNDCAATVLAVIERVRTAG